MIPDASKYTDRILNSDIEAIGFLDIVKTRDDVHCFASKDLETKEVYLFHDHPELDNVEVWDDIDKKVYIIPERTGTLDEGAKFWSLAAMNGSRLVVHNAMGYDKHVVERCWPDLEWPFDAWHDTFVQSKLQWFDRPRVKGSKSPHGLQAIGIKNGINKPPIDDFKIMTPYILHRVLEDVHIQEYAYVGLEKERIALKEVQKMDFGGSFKIEALYANKAALQEMSGALVDQDHLYGCVADLSEKLKALSDRIEPLLPPTVKAKTKRVSRSELAEALGYDKRKIKDKMVQRKRNGEIETVVEKPYYAPSVNFYNTEKGKLYSGSHVEHGFSPQFQKKGEYTAWRNTNHPDTKPKEWEVEVEETQVKQLDKNTCGYFDVSPEDVDIIVGPYTKVQFLETTMSQNEKVKGYAVRLGWKRAEEWNFKEGFNGGKVKVDVRTVVRWPPKAAPENQIVKIIPAGGMLVTSPKLEEDEYDQLPAGVGQDIAHYNTYAHRLRFIRNPKDPENKGLLSYVDERGRIPCGVNTYNTSTGRSSHRVWVNAPSHSAIYGDEIRAGIIAGVGRKLAAGDQKSSQLSIAAFFAKNSEYYKAVAEGSEYLEDEEGNKVIDPETGRPTYLGESAHCHSARNFGVVSHNEWMEAKRTQDSGMLHDLGLRRGFSKGASFGVIFGCSGGKLAGMLKIPEKEGTQKRDNFLTQMGLNDVKVFLEGCKERYPRAGGYYIPLAFGYWVFCSQDHKAINYLIQGTEALAQKLSELQMDKMVLAEGIEDHGYQILSMHDECLWDVEEGYEHKFGAIISKAYTWAADVIYKYYLKYPDKFPNKGGPVFKVDLSGGYDIGDNYGEVH